MRISNRLIIMGLLFIDGIRYSFGGMPRIIQVLLNISIPVIMLYRFLSHRCVGRRRYQTFFPLSVDLPNFKNIDRLCAGSICGRSSNSRAQDVVYAQS